jgi:hypothetical protein
MARTAYVFNIQPGMLSPMTEPEPSAVDNSPPQGSHLDEWSWTVFLLGAVVVGVWCVAEETVSVKALIVALCFLVTGFGLRIEGVIRNTQLRAQMGSGRDSQDVDPQ